jgi:hypothetical protein
MIGSAHPWLIIDDKIENVYRGASSESRSNPAELPQPVEAIAISPTVTLLTSHIERRRPSRRKSYRRP